MVEQEYITIRIFWEDYKYLLELQKKMRKRAVGDVIETLIKIIKENKLDGEFK